MIPAITDALMIAAVQTPGMLRAGQTYARQGRVSDLDLDSGLMMVTAHVRGSLKQPYWTSVIFPEDGDAAGIESECSCPVGYGCKHVAAVLSVLRDAAPHRPGLRIVAAANERAPQAKGALSDAVSAWIDRLTVENLSKRSVQADVCFVIEPKSAFKGGGKAAGRGKGGKASNAMPPARYLLQIRAWRKGHGSTVWQPFHPYELNYGRLTQVGPQALRLLARTGPVAAGGDFTADRVPQGRHGWQWLREAVAAGMLRWKKPDGPLLALAPHDLSARFAWQALEDGRRVLALAGLTEGLITFAGDPAIWLDEKAGLLGLIDTGLSHDVAARLLALPPVAAADIEPLARRWPDLVGDAVPAPALDDVAEIKVAPRPVLHFMIDKLDCLVTGKSWYRERYQPSPRKLVRLGFDYGGHRVAAPETMAEVFVRGEGVVMRVLRDLDAEQAAADRLTMTTLRPLADFGGVRPKPHQHWDHALPAGMGTYPDLLVNQIADLEREGWLIDHAPDWPDVHHPIEEAAPGLELIPAEGAEAQAGKIDWFDVELPALVNGVRIDILPALRQMLAEAGEALLERDDAHQLAMPLDGGGFTTIALGVVRPLLEALLRLALGERQVSALRVSRHDLGVIHALSGEGLGWTSADALPTLASALHDPHAIDYAAPAGLSADLRAYQRAGVVWLRALHEAGLGGILADDMGLGKTLQAIAHMLHVGQSVACGVRSCMLVVAPTSVLPNWQAEIARFAPGLRLLLWHGSDRRRMEGELEAVDVLLTSYPLLARDKDMLAGRDYALVVLDEAHVLKNPATAGFKAAAALKAAQTLALTGTPLENRLTDIWALTSLTNPGLLGTFEEFRKAYRAPIEKQGDAVARDALARRLRPFMLRRTKDEVASELPPKTLIPERIDLLDAQLRLYESQRLLMQERVRQEIDRVGLMRSQIIVLDAMLKLRQICCDPSLLPDGRGEGVASAKRARVLEMVPELVREGRRVIIFSQFTAMLDRLSTDLAGEGIDHEHLRGSTRDRAKPVRRFQKHEVAVILVSLKAGGAGVNLTAADTVILYDPWWNPAVEAQAIDRAHRIGQTKPVFVHRMIATGTIEDKILALQERKQGLADMLWSETGEVTGSSLDEDDIAFLLS